MCFEIGLEFDSIVESVLNNATSGLYDRNSIMKYG
jgi:hypothetical protein